MNNQKDLAESKLKKAKTFSLIAFIAMWISCFIVLGILLNKGVMMGAFLLSVERGSAVLGVLVVIILFALAVLLSALIRIKTYINICKIELGQAGKQSLTTKEDKAYLGVLSYLEVLMETIQMFFGFSIAALLITDGALQENWLWIISVLGVLFGHLYPKVYWQIICNNRISKAFCFEMVIEIIKVSLLAIMIVFLKRWSIKPLIERLYLSNNNVLNTYIAVSIARSGLHVLYMINLAMLFAFTNVEKIFTKKAGRHIVFVSILIVIDLILYAFLPSTLSIIERIYDGVAEARFFWIPMLLFWITLGLANNFPKGEVVHNDICQLFTRKNIQKEEEKEETKSGEQQSVNMQKPKKVEVKKTDDEELILE